MLEMTYNPNSTIALTFIDLQHDLVMTYMKAVITLVGVEGPEHL